MNILDINDGEYANFMEEMQEDERERRKALFHATRHNLPHETRIDLPTLRRLMQRHNQAIAMLREFLALHPEDSDLVSRARKLVNKSN
jgi:hypothetical protein